MIVVFLVLMTFMLAFFALVIYLIYLGIRKDSTDYDFQHMWLNINVTRQDMEFE